MCVQYTLQIRKGVRRADGGRRAGKPGDQNCKKLRKNFEVVRQKRKNTEKDFLVLPQEKKKKTAENLYFTIWDTQASKKRHCPKRQSTIFFQYFLFCRLGFSCHFVGTKHRQFNCSILTNNSIYSAGSAHQIVRCASSYSRRWYTGFIHSNAKKTMTTAVRPCVNAAANERAIPRRSWLS